AVGWAARIPLRGARPGPVGSGPRVGAGLALRVRRVGPPRVRLVPVGSGPRVGAGLARSVRRVGRPRARPVAPPRARRIAAEPVALLLPGPAVEGTAAVARAAAPERMTRQPAPARRRARAGRTQPRASRRRCAA